MSGRNVREDESRIERHGFRRKHLAFLSFVAAVVAAIAPIILTIPPISHKLSWNTTFLLWIIAAAAAFGLGLVGFLLLRFSRYPSGLFVTAVMLLGLNLAAVVLSSYYYSTKATCSGGYSGPCTEPMILCGGGFLLSIIAAGLVGAGIHLLWQMPPQAFIAPRWSCSSSLRAEWKPRQL
jgi:hypothetical protein